MVAPQATGLVPIIMFAPVRQVSTKIEQLQGTQQRGQYPKQQEVSLRYPYF